MDYKDLDFKIGCVNPSGIGETIYAVRKRDIKSWPKLVDDPDSTEAKGPGDLVSLVGDFILQEGKKFIRIYSTQGKGKLTFEPIGETDCKMFTNKASYSFPDLTPEAVGFSKMSVNDDFVYISKSAGRWHVIGSPDYRTVTAISGDTGDAAGSAKGLSISVECPDATPLPIYLGKINLANGDFDCAKGEFTTKGAQG